MEQAGDVIADLFCRLLIRCAMTRSGENETVAVVCRDIKKALYLNSFCRAAVLVVHESDPDFKTVDISAEGTGKESLELPISNAVTTGRKLFQYSDRWIF